MAISKKKLLTVFQQNLLDLLNKNNMTEAELCRRFFKKDAVTPGQRSRIYRWLHKGILPTLPDVIRLSELFGCSVDALVKPSHWPVVPSSEVLSKDREKFTAMVSELQRNHQELRKLVEADSASISTIRDFMHLVILKYDNKEAGANEKKRPRRSLVL